MKRLPLLLLALPLAAAEVCPPTAATPATGTTDGLTWRSAAHRYAKTKFCIADAIAIAARDSGVPIEWPDAGIDQASLAGNLSVQFCCFDAERIASGTLRHGSPLQAITVSTHIPDEEGAEGHNEGYPDLIEEDARISTISIRGTLWDGERPLRVDLLLRCSASQFAKEYAYQFTIEDRSADKVLVEWNLLRDLRARLTPSMQTTRFAHSFVFLSPTAPRESESVIEIRSPGNKVAGRFHVGGFTLSETAR